MARHGRVAAWGTSIFQTLAGRSSSVAFAQQQQCHFSSETVCGLVSQTSEAYGQGMQWLTPAPSVPQVHLLLPPLRQQLMPMPQAGTRGYASSTPQQQLQHEQPIQQQVHGYQVLWPPSDRGTGTQHQPSTTLQRPGHAQQQEQQHAHTCRDHQQHHHSTHEQQLQGSTQQLREQVRLGSSSHRAHSPEARAPQVAGSGQSSSSGVTTTDSERVASLVGGFSTGVTTLPTGQGFKRTFYKRKLPSPPSTAFSSAAGRQLFGEALASGHMGGFFKLMEQFSTQDEPAFCGLASLAMVLNALAIDPRRTWKGSWRWFHEQMLDCCRPLEDVKREGITLPQAACLARCNGARAELHRYGSFTLEELRRHVKEVCSSGDEHLVVSYSRRTFLQTGDGHFSPIGGYHPGQDLVLILDVARFKYPPHWVPLPMLHEAMQYVDPVTGHPRGFLRISARPLLDSVLLTLDIRSNKWQAAHEFVRTTAPQMLQELSSRPGFTAASALTALVTALPWDSCDAFLAARDFSGPGSGGSPPPPLQPSSSSSSGHTHTPAAAAGVHVPERCTPVAARQQLLAELWSTPLYQVVSTLIASHSKHATEGQQQVACDNSECSTTTSPSLPGPASRQPGQLLAEKVTTLLLLRRPSAWPSCWGPGGDSAGAAAAAWSALMDTSHLSILEAELSYLREQAEHIEEVLSEGGDMDAQCGSGCAQKLDCAAHGHLGSSSSSASSSST